MITYSQFKAKYPPGSSVASPEGTYKGQCVSYVRQYMAQVHGVETAPLGNAVDFATNPTFLKYYEKVPSRKVGDIMIWGDDPGSWTGTAGHDAIYDGYDKMMNQNYDNSLVVSRNTIFSPGFIGYYRLKGEYMDKPTKAEVESAFDYIGREPTDSEYSYYTSRSRKVLYTNVIKALYKKYKAAQQPAVVLAPGKYEVK